MKKKLAIFDLDGTLFNTSDVNYKAYSEALQTYGYNMDYEYFCNYCNGRHYKEFLPNIINDNPEIINDIHITKKENYKKHLQFAKPNMHLFNLAQLIKEEYYLAVVTTASKTNTYDILNFFDKTTLFDLIITHEDIKNVKPDPEGFVKAMAHFNINSSDTIIFEDSIPGIEAAKKTNATVFVVNNF